ncbi:MAG: hypothetical protein IIY62_07410 [Kiritimatiellae bacterium]|nr:hypothetical protein [Kiritimatiellia bacterium]
MRRFSAIVRATALEICSEPLALLLTLSAMALAFLAPNLHYHQFGDPKRMAMESGLSAQLILGFAYVVFCTVRAFRREIESGTLQMVLAHSVSRGMFFTAKALGAFLSYLVFAATVFALTVTVTRGAALGEAVARRTNDIPVPFGPSVALATAAVVVPLVAAALLNYVRRFRFTLTATAFLALAANGVQFVFFDGGLYARLLPLAVLIVFPAAVVLACAAACAVVWRANVAISLAGALCALMLPMFGNYYLPGALARGGSLPGAYLLLAGGVSVPLVLAFVLAGVALFEGREVAGE